MGGGLRDPIPWISTFPLADVQLEISAESAMLRKYPFLSYQMMRDLEEQLWVTRGLVLEVRRSNREGSAQTSCIPALRGPPALSEPRFRYVSAIAIISVTKASTADVPRFRFSCRAPHIRTWSPHRWVRIF